MKKIRMLIVDLGMYAVGFLGMLFAFPVGVPVLISLLAAAYVVPLALFAPSVPVMTAIAVSFLGSIVTFFIIFVVFLKKQDKRQPTPNHR